MKSTIPSTRLGPQPRLELVNLAPGVHGGVDDAELARLGMKAGAVLDFSANLNPHGPAPAVRDILAQCPLDRYPDPECRRLRQALADPWGVSPSRILAGNGASELIWLCALAFVQNSDKVFQLGPTYGEYGRAARLMGGSVITWQAREEDQFAVNLPQVGKALDRLRPRLVFLCNPNNPTGVSIPPDEIACWARRHPETVFVVDEAYQFTWQPQCSARNIGADNVVVIRSMTKDFGLAGLRLGYAFGTEEMMGWLARVQPPWSVNALAQAAGLAALGEIDYYRQTWQLLARAKEKLVAGLQALGLRPLPSPVPFFLVPVRNGSAWRQSLFRRGILVRDCASFGLPGHIRIAGRTTEDNARLLTAIEQVQREEAAHAG